jgi:competence protein ComEC
MEVVPRLTDHRLTTSVWQAPLVPAALAVTAGIVLDRYASVPLSVSLVFAVACLLCGLGTLRFRRTNLSLVYLLLAAVAIGSSYHHYWRNGYTSDHIGNRVNDEPRIAKLRGTVIDETLVKRGARGDPLRSFDMVDRSTTVLEATEILDGTEWRCISGKVRLVLLGDDARLPVGSFIEAVGRLSTPEAPANPGEFDYASMLRDRRIRATLIVEYTDGATISLPPGETWSLRVQLGRIREWGRCILGEYLPPEVAPVAVALLLGDGSAMDQSEWDKYQRTGVIHVLVVSGQHLVVIAMFLWFVFRLALVRRRHAAIWIALVLFAYAALSGGRPPAVRAAVIVAVYCVALSIRRIPLTTNSFALAWLIVVAMNPTYIFDVGSQLSFLSVAILYWGASQWFQTERDPLDRLVDESRPRWERWVRSVTGKIGLSYAVTLTVWLAIAPLITSRYHLVCPIALIIGPPVVLLASIALISGFLLLFTAALGFPLAWWFAEITRLSLTSCEWLVDVADRIPFGHFYVGNVPEAWLWVLYVGLLSFLLLPALQSRWRLGLCAAVVWLCVGMLGMPSDRADEFRCTFLAVGHGGCTIMETPDGRVLLYDAGAMTGPEVTQRQIAPFLWFRGITRIDEIFLSHADLDHFNGLPALLERFSVAHATCTPTFTEKYAPGVAVTLEALRRHNVPLRIVQAGDRLQAGDVTMQVLHPSARGPEGRENFRSMVLHVEYGGNSMLLTGDLEGPGLEQVVRIPPSRADVLMAPHHGSRAGPSVEEHNRAELIHWTKPSVIVACQGRPRSTLRNDDAYSMSGIPWLGTWPHGAITIRFRPGEFSVETYRTGMRFEFPRRLAMH